MHTPYGATEALPICSIAGSEVLHETAAMTRIGAGTCVGRAFPGIQIKVIEITHGPIQHLERVRELPPVSVGPVGSERAIHHVGEILVSGPVVTRQYYRNDEATLLAKIPDGDRFWHRMGDVGYLDDHGRLWFCGRKAHVVETEYGRLFTICCEAIFNQHPRVFRSALVGIGEKPNQRPVIVVEPEAGQFPTSTTDQNQLRSELLNLGRANPLTKDIADILFHPSLPVDIRHNVKIFREKLVPWAERELQVGRGRLLPGGQR